MAIRATASADSVILAIKRPGDVIIGRACGASWVELVGETGCARRTAADTVRVLVGEDDQASCTIADNLRFAGLGAPAVDTARLEQIGPGGAESAILVVAPEVAVRIPPPPPPPPAQTQVAVQIPPPPTPTPASLPGSAAIRLHCPAGHRLVRFSASPCSIDQCGYGCERGAIPSTGRCGLMAKAPSSCRVAPPSPDLGGDDAADS